MKPKNKRRSFLVIFIVIVVGVVISIWNPKINIFSSRESNAGVWQPVYVDKENFAEFLSNLNVVQELPKDAVISLKLYNFDSGERSWEKSYIIEKSKVNEGRAENPDLEFIMHSKYIGEFGEKGPCYALRHANSNNDLAYEFFVSETALAWKYKGMFKYKDCLF